MDIGEEVLDYSESDGEGADEERDIHEPDNVSDAEEERHLMETEVGNSDDDDHLPDNVAEFQVRDPPKSSDTNDLGSPETHAASRTSELYEQASSQEEDNAGQETISSPDNFDGSFEGDIHGNDDGIPDDEDIIGDDVVPDNDGIHGDDEGIPDHDVVSDDDGIPHEDDDDDGIPHDDDDDDGIPHDDDDDDDGIPHDDDDDDGIPHDDDDDNGIPHDDDDDGFLDDHKTTQDDADQEVESSEHKPHITSTGGVEESSPGDTTPKKEDEGEVPELADVSSQLDQMGPSGGVEGLDQEFTPSSPQHQHTTISDLFASDDDDDGVPPKAKRNRLNSEEDEQGYLEPVQESEFPQEIQEQEVDVEEEEVVNQDGDEQGDDEEQGSQSGDESLAAELAELNEEGGDVEVGVAVEDYKEEQDEVNDEELEGGPSDSKIMVYDFDLMLEKKKQKAKRSRKKNNQDIQLSAHDDVTISLMEKMKAAAEEDRKLNLAQKAATKKLALLPLVSSSLKKPDIASRFIDVGGLDSMSDWLSPLPDHSLPSQKIRETMLDVLRSFPPLDAYTLKKSRIGKAVMLLYRHPKELRKNKEKAGRLVQEWARPIFGLASDFKTLTRDEREERDYANITPTARRRLSSTEEGQKKTGMEIDAALKPGDKGWIGRARVPMPSNKDYIVRPKWNVETEYAKGGGKKNLNRYDKQVLKFKEQKRAKGSSHAVKVNVAGNRMVL